MSNAELVPHIRARCTELERALVVGKRVIVEAVAREQPGAGTRPDTPIDWFDYAVWLHRQAWEAERPATSPAAGADSANVDRLFSAALLNRPAEVRCADGETRLVYPKSYNALRFLDELEVLHQLAEAQARLARAFEVPEDRAVVALTPRVESLAVRLWLWIITAPDPALPFDEHAPLDEGAMPAWLGAVAPEDLLRFAQAHARVNRVRLQLIADMFPPDPGEQHPSRLTLAGFLGSIVDENEPTAADRLLKHTSLGQVFAIRVAAAQRARESLAASKAGDA